MSRRRGINKRGYGRIEMKEGKDGGGKGIRTDTVG